MSAIGILGAGSWGTALAVHLARAGHTALLWGRESGFVQRLAGERRNEAYLPGVAFPEGLLPTADLAALGECEVVLIVVPSHGFREVLRRFLAATAHERPLRLLSGTKGIEIETLARMSRVAFEEGVSADREIQFAVLSGPTFAVELAAGEPTAAVIAAEDDRLASELRERLSDRVLRLYSSSDVVGVEMGAACKNVIAIAAGVVAGLGLGNNTLAALVTRGLHEITRLGLACGGQPRTFSGLAGLGDLVLTCTGEPSRNRRAGLELARGLSRDEITSRTPMVAEGIRNSLAVARLARERGVEMPITEQMVEVVHHGRPPRQALEELMTRERKGEAEL